MTTSKLKKYKFNEKLILKVKILLKKSLNKLTPELNYLHKYNFDQKQWELLLGQWIFSFTKIFFRIYFSEKTVKIKKNDKLIIPKNSYEDFINLISKNRWEDSIKNQILNHKKNKKLYISKAEIFENENKINYFKILLIKLHNQICSLFKCYFSKKKIFIHNTYLGRINEILLQLKFKELPIIFFKYPNYICNYNILVREQIIKKISKNENKFHKLYFKTLIYNMPLNFVEGFKIIDDFLKKSFLPNKLKFVFNSNEIIVDDYFKLWIAKQKKNCKIILSQHGLNYQITTEHSPQSGTTETSYVDKIFVWGNKKKNKKYENMFMIPKRKFIVKNKKNLILVMNQSAPNYHYFDNTSYFLKSFEINKFLNSIDENIKKLLIIRLHKNNFPPYKTNKIINLINQNSKNKKLNIDKGKKKMTDLVTNSKLLVFSYPSSGFLEALSQNIPTILVWKNFKYECTNSAKNDFLKLVKLKLMFFEEKELSKFINQNWNIIDDWWNKIKKQKNISIFKYKYCVFENDQFLRVYNKLKLVTKN